jgi:hypothetical protein
LLAHVTKQKSPAKPTSTCTVPQSDIQKVLGTNRPNNNSNDDNKSIPSEFIVGGKVYCLVNTACIIYCVTALTSQCSSLIDFGANGGIAGDNVHIISKLLQLFDIEGIDKHQLTCIPIVTAGGVVHS